MGKKPTNAMSVTNQEKFKWPDHIWTILPDGETKYWDRCLIDYDQASYTREEGINVNIETFSPEDLGEKCFLSEVEAFRWLQIKTLEFYTEISIKKNEAQRRIARPQ